MHPVHIVNALPKWHTCTCTYIHTYIHTNSPTITHPSLSYFLFPRCLSVLSLSLDKLWTCGVIRSSNFRVLKTCARYSPVRCFPTCWSANPTFAIVLHAFCPQLSQSEDGKCGNTDPTFATLRTTIKTQGSRPKVFTPANHKFFAVDMMRRLIMDIVRTWKFAH